MRNTLKQQIAWAKGRAAQAKRLASRASLHKPSHAHALEQQAMAEAVAASLQKLQRQEPCS